MKVYISGAITGLTQDEYHHNFGRAEALLLDMEHDPVNPIKVPACETEDCHERLELVPAGQSPSKPDGSYLHQYGCYMKHDLIALLECDAILMLPNWQRSRGAQAELEVAQICGMPVAYLDSDYKIYRTWFARTES